MSGKRSAEYDVIPFGEGGDPDPNEKGLDGFCHTVQVNGEDVVKCRPRCDGGLCLQFQDDSQGNDENSQCTVSFLGKTCNSCQVCSQGDKVKIAFDCSNQICGGNVGLTCQGEALSTDCPGHSSPPSESSATTVSSSSSKADAVTIGAFVGGAVFSMLALTLLLGVFHVRRRRRGCRQQTASGSSSSEPKPVVPKEIQSEDSSVSSVSDEEEEDNGDIENGTVGSFVNE